MCPKKIFVEAHGRNQDQIVLRNYFLIKNEPAYTSNKWKMILKINQKFWPVCTASTAETFFFSSITWSIPKMKNYLSFGRSCGRKTKSFCRPRLTAMSNYLMLNYAMSNDTMLIYAMSNYVTLKYQVSKYSMSNCEMSNDKTCQGSLRLLRLSTDQQRVLPPKLVESFVHSIKTLIQNCWD